MYAIISGLILGVISSYGDTLFNNGQFDIVLLVTGYFNTATVWGITAFLIGGKTENKKLAALLGVIVLIFAVVSYYSYGVLFGNRNDIPIITILKTAGLWALVGIVIGSIYGIAGSIYKYTLKATQKVISVGLLSVLILAENGFFLYQGKEYLSQLNPLEILNIIMFILGIVLPFILLKDFKKALATTLISLILSIIAAMILSQILILIRGY